MGNEPPLIASHLSPAQQINCGEALETTTADRVAILVAHPVFLLIDCTGACRGCNKLIALPPAPPAPRPLCQCHFQSSDLRRLLPQSSSHTSTGAWRQEGGGLSLLKKVAENSPTAGKMKILCSGEVCDHKGQTELDTSIEVRSRVFVSFLQIGRRRGGYSGCEGGGLCGCNSAVGVNRPEERENSRDCHQLSP